MDRALQYGKLKESDWTHCQVITGAVTPELVEMLLNMPKPMDTVVSNKMTPFFSIFFDNGFRHSLIEMKRILLERI